MEPAPIPVDQLLQKHLRLLQGVEESIRGRELVVCTDLTQIGRELTKPRSLQHIDHYLDTVITANWSDPAVLKNSVLPYLREVCEFFEAVIGGHRRAQEIFSAAPDEGYCLYLRSFSRVTTGVEAAGSRVVLFQNDAELDANFAMALAQHSDWLNPVTCLHTDDMNLLLGRAGSIPGFRVHMHNWQGLLADAIAGSRAIVFYIDDDSPGVEFELDCILQRDLASRTAVVHRGGTPDFTKRSKFAAVMPISSCLTASPTGTGPGKLSQSILRVLHRLSEDGIRTPAVSGALRELPCAIVDPMLPAGVTESFNAETSYFVTATTAPAFKWYLENLPDSLERWNGVSQDMRLRGIQPTAERFNQLFKGLRMALAGALCLGFCASTAAMLGLLAKVASMAKTRDPEANREHRVLTLEVTTIADRFNALSERGEWGEKIAAFRGSILEDPFF
jgi:hypothetical protein